MANEVYRVGLSKEVIEQLNSALDEYYECNSAFNSIKHNRDVYNDFIKGLMKSNNINKYSTDDGVNASLTITNKPKYNEEAMIEYLRQFNIPDLIKTKEYIDMEVLEDCLYHNQIDAVQLAPFKEDKLTETLRVTKSQKLNEG